MSRCPLLGPLVLCLCALSTPVPDAAAAAGAAESYDLAFSTYLGGSNWDYARDVCTDAQGNVYVAGASSSSDFPTTPGVLQTKQDKTGNHVGPFGYCDAFVAKLDPTGKLIWSTYLGGPNYDRAYAVKVDRQGCVYVAGRAGPGFPTTKGAFQPDFKGVDQGGYGWQNAFVAKLSPDGSKLAWASFVGYAEMCRDMDIDAKGDIYLPLAKSRLSFVPPGSNYALPPEWFAHAYQKAPKGGSDCGAIKVSSDGTRVLWATFLGGSGNESTAGSIRVDAVGCVHLHLNTHSTDMPTTAGACDRMYRGGSDGYVARLSADGSNLLFGTYLGGTGDEFLSTHALGLDTQGNTYIATFTKSTDFPVTPGALQSGYGGGTSDVGVAKLDSSGALICSTYLGGSSGENADGICVDGAGNVFVSGSTDSVNFAVTPGAVQNALGGQHDTFVARLSADFRQLLYATYLGGPSYDAAYSGFLDQGGNLYVTGGSDGPGWPSKNACQPGFHGGHDSYGVGDAILARFTLGRER